MKEQNEEKRLDGIKVAILATDYFESVELTKPKEAFEKEGAEVYVISPKSREIQGLNHVEMAGKVTVDMILDEVDPKDFDALFLPGGAINADNLRVDEKAKKFVLKIEEDDKPIAVICHGSWILASTNLTKGRTMTSYHTIKDDLRNAGARWIDYEVVWDENWVSSRGPQDLPAFIDAAIDLFSEYGMEIEAEDEDEEEEEELL